MIEEGGVGEPKTHDQMGQAMEYYHMIIYQDTEIVVSHLGPPYTYAMLS